LVISSLEGGNVAVRFLGSQHARLTLADEMTIMAFPIPARFVNSARLLAVR
jgi:hypothetical protein